MRHALLAACLACAAVPAAAFPLPYAMPNGSGVASGGTYNYWDVTYDRPGAPVTTDGAPLLGGFGKLTDGVTTTAIWSDVSNLDGTGPYVGWAASTTPTLEITFFWPIPVCLIASCAQAFDGVTLWLDNSGTGGVAAPASLTVNGVSVTFTPPAPGTAGPVDIDLRPFDLSGYLATISLGYAGEWIFISEVEWDVRFVGSIPGPAALGLFGAGLLGLAALRRRPG